MTTNQIYDLVNAVAGEGLGTEGNLVVTNNETLVAFGSTILSSRNNTEAFLNTLIQRVGKTIFSYRKYTGSDAQDLTRDTMEMGAILQKVKVKMIKAKFDPSYDLSPDAVDPDGNPVNRDPFTVAAPEVRQSLFVKRTPGMYEITVPVDLLNEAFVSTEAMGSFISMIYGEVRNSIEYGLNALAKTVQVTGMTQILRYKESNNLRYIDLLAEAMEYGIVTTETITVWTDALIKKYLQDENFLKYAIQRINGIVDMMGELTTNFSEGGDAHFTPENSLKVLLASEFVRSAETYVQAGAFNDEKVSVKAKYRSVPFWQASKGGAQNSEGHYTPLAGATSAQVPKKLVPMCIAVSPFEGVDYPYEQTDVLFQNMTGLTIDGSNYNPDNVDLYTSIAAVVPVLGIAFDKTAMGIVERPERDYSILNPKDQTYHNYYHVNNMYYFDKHENMVLFTLGNPVIYAKDARAATGALCTVDEFGNVTPLS